MVKIFCKGNFLVIFLMIFSFSWDQVRGADLYQIPSNHFFPSRVGCFLPPSPLHKLDCSQQLLNFEILKKLNNSTHKFSRDYLTHLILKRARYFLQKEISDYQSVISLMVFPIKSKEKWLTLFSHFPSGPLPYAQIALNRVRGKKNEFCVSKGKKIFFSLPLREVCTLKIL